MKIFDCFMYFDEEIILDLRLNILDKYVDYFVIVESLFTHKGDKRELQFDLKKFERFKDKIIYLIYDKLPKNLEKVMDEDNKGEKSRKYILNAAYRENGQRNFISRGLENAKEDDLILISDVDEIPNLENIDLNHIKKRIIFFKQDMFYYKFNLKLPNLIWTGTKACRKIHLKSPQWLRNIKDRKYPFYRLDTIFSETKYIDVEFIDKGGWHFSYLQTPEQILNKIKSFSHGEFNDENLNEKEIALKILNNQDIFGRGSKLNKVEIDQSYPEFILRNKNKFTKWII